MWLVSIAWGAWAVLLALWGRARLAFGLLAIAWLSVLALAFTVFTLPVGFVVGVVGWIAVIRTIRGRRSRTAMVRRIGGRRPERTDIAWAVVAFVAPLVVGSFLPFAIEMDRVPSQSMAPALESGDHFVVDKLSLRWRPVGRGDVVVFAGPDDRTMIKRVVALGGEVVAVTHGVVSIDGKPVPTTPRGKTTYWETNDLQEDDSRSVPALAFDEDLGGHHVVLHQSLDDHDAYGVVEDRDYPRTDRPGLRCEDATPARLPWLHDAPPSWPAATSAPGGCRVPDGALFVLGDNRDDSSDSRIWGPVPVDRVIGRVGGVWLPAASPDRAWSRIGAVR